MASGSRRVGDPCASLSRARRRFPLWRGVPATLLDRAPPRPRAALAIVVRASSRLLAYSLGAVDIAPPLSSLCMAFAPPRATIAFHRPHRRSQRPCPPLENTTMPTGTVKWFNANQGLRVHRARRWLERRFRAHLRGRTGRTRDAPRRAESAVRGATRSGRQILGRGPLCRRIGAASG